MSQETIDISGLDKAAVLAALFNGTRPMGMGFLQAGLGPQVMTVEDARRVIDGGDDHDRNFPGISDNKRELYFDYVYGRPLKSRIDGDTFDPWLYDRDAGQGVAARVIQRLRDTGKVS